MSDRDRISRLEYDLARVSRQIAGLPVRLAQTGGDSETYRLIRGQAVGASSGATLLIDNVIVLSGGVDPTDGNPAAAVSIANIFSQSFSDNEWLDAVYSPGVSVSPAADWEALKTSSGTETFRLVRGSAVGAVTADDDPFNIDNIEVLAGGLDPRVVPGDAAETLSVVNIAAEGFLNDAAVTAIYNADAEEWEVLRVERYRAIRGDWYSGTSTLVVKAIVVLDSGLDPRTDPTSSTEAVNVTNVPGDTYTTGDKVYADYNVKDGVWEARPKNSGGGATIVVKISGTISARSGTTRGSGSAQPVNAGTLANEGGTITVYNLSGNFYDGSAGSGGPLYCLAFLIGSEYFIDNPDLRSINNFAENEYLGAEDGLPKWRVFETDEIGGTAECVDGVITITILPDTFVIPPS